MSKNFENYHESLICGDADPFFTPLTGFDYQWGNVAIRRLLYFPGPLDTSELKSGLEEVLQRYPVLGGRIEERDGVLGISAEKQGVLFAEANSNQLMPKVGLGAEPHKKDIYVPDIESKAVMQGEAPGFKIQVTNFPDGAIIGLCSSHLFVDGTGFWDFVLDWARCMSGEPLENQPVMDRQPCFDIAAAGEAKSPDELSLKKMRLKSILKLLVSVFRGLKSNSSRMWQIDEETISEIKSLAGGERLSRFDLIGALVFKLIGEAQRANDQLGIISVYNLRNMDVLPIQPNYLGNALVTTEVLLDSSKGSNHSIVSVGKELKAGKNNITVKGVTDFSAFYQTQVEAGKLGGSGRVSSVLQKGIWNALTGSGCAFNVWAFPIYDFTIQGHRAVWYDFVQSPVMQALSSLVIMPAPEGGLLVKVNTRKPVLKILEQQLDIKNNRPDVNALRKLNWLS